MLPARGLPGRAADAGTGAAMAVGRVLVEKHVAVPLRGGAVTRGDLYRPAEGPPVPGLVCRTPYDKETIGRTAVLPSPLKLAEEGYAVLVADVRGRYASEGEFHPFRHEGRDGCDTIEWMAAQPFCDGAVGVFGLSYYGATALLAARERPSALRCAIAIVTASDYFDDWTHYGGALQLGFSGTWGMGLAAAQLLRGDCEVAPEHAEALAQAMAEPLAALRHRPPAALPGLSAPKVAPWWAEWLEHDRRDAHWEALRLSRDYAAFGVPVMHVGGWFDLFTLGTVRNYQGMREAGAAPQRLWMGPWSHTSYERYHGDVDFGGTAPVALCGLAEAYLAFLGEHLRGEEPAEPQPEVRYFLMGANEWRDAAAWPPPEARERTLWLRGGGEANSARGDGRLDSAPPPAGEPADRYLYDPERPVPTEGGSLLQAAIGQPGPREQSAIEARDDVLCYTTAPLERPLAVAGPVTVELWAATDGPDTDWTAKLTDVAPDGRSISLCDGVRRASFRESLADPSPVTPGEPHRCAIELGSTAHRFAAGHRLRLQVSSSNFPRFDANPNTGEPSWRAVETRPAVQRVLHDAAHPSALRVWALTE